MKSGEKERGKPSMKSSISRFRYRKKGLSLCIVGKKNDLPMIVNDALGSLDSVPERIAKLTFLRKIPKG